MSIEEAIKNLNIMLDSAQRRTRRNIVIPDLIEAIEMAIEALEEQKWIPCSERLPEENGYYLVTIQGMCRPYIRKLGFSATSNKWGCGGVIAWMDVKPYKEEGEDE